MTTAIRILATVVLITLLVTMPALAATRTWDNDSGDGLWHTAANWNPTGVPGAGDTAIIDDSENWLVVLSDDDAECAILKIQGTGGILDIKGVTLTLGDDNTDMESVVEGTIRFFKVGSARAEISVRKWVKFTGNGRFLATGASNPNPDLAKFTRAASSARGVHFEDVSVLGNFQFLVSVKHDAFTFEVKGSTGDTHMKFGEALAVFSPALEISDVSTAKDRKFLSDIATIVFYRVEFGTYAPDWVTDGDLNFGGTFVVDGDVVNNPPNDIILVEKGSLVVNRDFKCTGTLSHKGTITVKGGKIAKFEP